MDDSFNSEDAFAFGIKLGGNQAKVNLEDRQVIHRSLDHDLQSRMLFLSGSRGAFLGAKNGSQSLDIESCPGMIDDALKDLIHFGPSFKKQVATVFGLEDRIVVTKVGSLLFFQIQGKA